MLDNRLHRDHRKRDALVYSEGQGYFAGLGWTFDENNAVAMTRARAEDLIQTFHRVLKLTGDETRIYEILDAGCAIE